MDSKIIKILLILIFLASTAQAVEFKGKFIQGHYIIGKTDPGAQITIDKKKIPKFPSMTIEEIEINTKILNSWINLK